LAITVLSFAAVLYQRHRPDLCQPCLCISQIPYGCPRLGYGSRPSGSHRTEVALTPASPVRFPPDLWWLCPVAIYGEVSLRWGLPLVKNR